MGQNWVGWCVKAGLELRPREWDGTAGGGFIKGSRGPDGPFQTVRGRGFIEDHTEDVERWREI